MQSFLLFLAVLFSSTNSFGDDVLDRLNQIDGMRAEENTTEDERIRGLRKFRATFEQPIDHCQGNSAHFRQRLVIFHRGFNEPMVLQTSGYKIFGERLTGLAQTFSTNQIQVEHRFFGDSVPENLDWSKLTVAQSAADFHRVVQALKPLYGARWINTGASKGGMTSIFHRRHYPHDLDGTVADVAPISFALEDPRYVDFLNSVGGKSYQGCRERLASFQKIILNRRDSIKPFLNQSYSVIGSSDKALEYAAIELPFNFWQSGDPNSTQFGCEAIPTVESTDDQLRSFFFKVNSPETFSDDKMKIYQPYFVQAAMELGGPGSELGHLRGHLRFDYNLQSLLPRTSIPQYSNYAMMDVQDWVIQEATSMMFIYGEFDPWSAGAYMLHASPGRNENYLYTIPQSNHRSNFLKLPLNERLQALDVLENWFQKKATVNSLFSTFLEEEALEDLEDRILHAP